MPNVESILLEIKKLSTIEQENVLSTLEEVLLFGSHVGRISQEVMESRFSKGKVYSDISANHAGRASLTSRISDIQESLILGEVIQVHEVHDCWLLYPKKC